ncbi:MAG: MerR family transcriptional regulator [Oscillospiraceae bacterium]|nr:MerR family transcriptional regulator [Oscillospiraceae bacterium]
MITRGQFAVMGNVGRKALRLYQEEGILIPVYINKDNGYHYYDESQLETLEKIKRFRKLGLSLFEIRQILDGNASETEIIEGRIKETDQLLSEMKAYKTGTEHDNSGSNEELIDHRSFERCNCIYICENTEREDLGMSVGKLYERASREVLNISGDHFVIYDGLDNESFSMKTCLPVSEHTGDDVLEISEEKCIHIKFRGGFSKVWKAHRMLRDYADEHSIILAGRIYEVYNKDMSVDVYYAIILQKA